MRKAKTTDGGKRSLLWDRVVYCTRQITCAHLTPTRVLASLLPNCKSTARVIPSSSSVLLLCILLVLELHTRTV